MASLYTFGDSILDCGRYNPYRVHPAQLLLRNDDRLFPELRGQDVTTLWGGAVRLEHRAQDGATVDALESQLSQGPVRPAGDAVVLVTIGGNDLLGGLLLNRGPARTHFEARLRRFLRHLGGAQLLLGTVYDPTFGDDRQNFLPVPAGLAREALAWVNQTLRGLGDDFGRTVDLHAHFLRGHPSWFTFTIEPSLRGASEVRRAFLPHVLAALREQRTTEATW